MPPDFAFRVNYRDALCRNLREILFGSLLVASGRGPRVQRFPAATQRAARFRFSALSNFTGSMVGAGAPAIQAHLSPTVQQETRARFACQARLHIIWIRQSVWMRCIVLVRHWQRLALQIGSMRGLSWVGDRECSATGRGVSRTQNK